ncbi:NAD(P)-binding domain-containing protein, partial [Candidatus Pelagibacter sp.]|nr:NAD(P)-binding domain-containing protein [Candidatus Pelagibacter sp.]
MNKHIAFIGVGNMGNPMAQQLVNAGKQVKVFDVSEQAIKIAKETGLNVVNSLDELLSNSS